MVEGDCVAGGEDGGNGRSLWDADLNGWWLGDIVELNGCFTILEVVAGPGYDVVGYPTWARMAVRYSWLMES
jgi:hypothetical protein